MLKTHYIQTAPREQQYQHPQEPVPDEWNNSVPPPPRRKNKGKKHSHRRVWKSSPQKCLHPEVFEILEPIRASAWLNYTKTRLQRERRTENWIAIGVWNGQSRTKRSGSGVKLGGLLLARGLCSFGFLPVAPTEKEKETATASQYKYA